MQRKKQILLALFISSVLVAISLSASLRKPQESYISVVSLKAEVPAGTIILQEHLTIVQLPEKLNISAYLNDIKSVAGQSTDRALHTGQLLDRRWLNAQPNGIIYPEAITDGRLYTLRLAAENANGFWLAAGNVVDVHLIPKKAPSEEVPDILPNVRIVSLIGAGREQLAGSASAVVSGSSSSNLPLICLSVNTSQARALAIAETMCTIKLVPVNEPLRAVVQFEGIVSD